jgi:FkbM family methyltransferase
MFNNVRGHTFVASLLGPKPTILDLGANHGDFSRLMSERFGGSYFLAEANPILAKALAETDGNFHVWHCAVADRDGTLDFHIAAHDESSSVLPLEEEPATPERTPQRVSVIARSVDSLLREVTAGRFDLVKMDIEGLEAPALLSIPAEILQKIGQITVEFHCDPRFGRASRPEVEKAIRYLRANGFLSLNFSGTTLTDVLFVNRRLYQIPAWKGYLWEMAGWRPLWLRNLRRFVPGKLRDAGNKAVDLLSGRAQRP